MNGKVFSIVVAMVGAVILTGCGMLFPTPTINRQRSFDFGAPEKNHPVPVEVQRFNSDSPVRYKMQFRYGNELRVHDWERWIQPPATMLTCYLRLYFANKDVNHKFEQPKYRLTGSILTFEAIPEQKIAVLAFRYEILNIDGDKVLRSGVIEERVSYDDLDGAPGEDFSTAMSKAAAQSAEKLAVVMDGLE